MIGEANVRPIKNGLNVSTVCPCVKVVQLLVGTPGLRAAPHGHGPSLSEAAAPALPRRRQRPDGGETGGGGRQAMGPLPLPVEEHREDEAAPRPLQPRVARPARAPLHRAD